MTGDVGLLEKGAQSRLQKEKEREMGMSWRDLLHNMNEQNNSGLETAALCSLLSDCDGRGSTGPSTRTSKCGFLNGPTPYIASKSLAYSTKFHSGRINDV